MQNLLEIQTMPVFNELRLNRPSANRKRVHGRGARSNETGRYEQEKRDVFHDDWETHQELICTQTTTVHLETAKSIIAHNDSPDLLFEQSINPYRGCEHGCIYCYARPTHAFLGHSPGLDFEMKLYAKTNAAELLEAEFKRPGYKVKTIALGAATDAYQPIERTYKITRQLLEVLACYNHPVGIVTKSHLITRDIDILSHMAARGLVKVAVSLTTLNPEVARKMEPRAATPQRRLQTIELLSAAGIPLTVMAAPIVPGLNDHEIERIVCAAKRAGVSSGAYVMLRLPLELKQLFREWLATEFPNRQRRIIKLLQEMHGGKDYTAEFGARQRGKGPFANLVALRFRQALQRYGLAKKSPDLRTDLFKRPHKHHRQMDLFTD